MLRRALYSMSSLHSPLTICYYEQDVAIARELTGERQNGK